MQTMDVYLVNGVALRKKCLMDCRQLGIIWMCKFRRQCVLANVNLESILQSEGHKKVNQEINIDICSFSTSIDTLLEDEEQFADQLKEYYAFGDSLR